MKTAKFWVDWALEAGDAHVVHRYWFTIDFSDEDYEELYQFWYDNNCDLQSWYLDEKGHEVMYEKINDIATNSLLELMAKHEPEIVAPLDVYWEISEETADEF